MSRRSCMQLGARAALQRPLCARESPYKHSLPIGEAGGEHHPGGPQERRLQVRASCHTNEHYADFTD